jgi:hypothetical protein
MSNRLFQTISLLVAILIGQAALAQDPGVPDTVYFGQDGKAYSHPGNRFRIPVYITSDEYLAGLSIGLEYGFTAISPQYDSVSKLGSVFMDGSYFEIGQVMTNEGSINGIMPDTLCMGGAAINNSLPPGKHKYCDVWFTGGNSGDQIVADSAWTPPACEILFMMGGELIEFIPQIVTGTLTLEPSPALIFPTVPSSTVGDAASPITWEVSAAGYYPPISIVLDSIVNSVTDSLVPYVPPTSGTNPLSVTWTPTYAEYGNFTAHYTATDAWDGKLNFTSPITVNYVYPPCEVFRGDANCNDFVDIDDVVHLINYIFAGGPPPGCPEK